MSSRIGRATRSDLILALKVLAPYFAVIVFWCWLGNAWLAILAYHAQILLWSRGTMARLGRPGRDPLAWLLVPSALAGPALYFLLPYITRTDLAIWLRAHGLAGWSLVLMVAYFGLVHPFLEQLHWSPLREATPVAHLLFAGYHVLVLYTLLSVPWLAVCFAVLSTASVVWQRMERGGGLGLPIASHVLADLGIVLAAWLRG
jgi:hypothetical protein